MKTTSLLAVALFAAAGLPICAMQPPAEAPSAPAATSPDPQQSTQQPASTQETPAASPNSAAQSQPGDAAAEPERSAAAARLSNLQPVSGELVSKLDSKTAKTGDEFSIKTQSAVKTSDGTEIPKGSKLTGHVIAVQPSGGGSTSQVAVNIDKAELKGGQTVPIHSEIQAIGSSDTESGNSSNPGANATGRPSGPGSNAAGGTSDASNASAAAPGYAPGYTPGTTTSNAPAAGTIVARTGHIAIRTTSMPGIMLANNAPGEEDPRMAQASGILLGSKKDVQLESGTKVVVGIAAASDSSSSGASGVSSSTAAPAGAQ